MKEKDLLGSFMITIILAFFFVLLIRICCDISEIKEQILNFQENVGRIK